MSGEATIGLDQRLVQEITWQIGSDLSMVIGRDFVIDSVEVERVRNRVSGGKGIQIALRLQIERNGRSYQASLLMPLPDALSVACYLMVMPDEAVRAQRRNTTLNRDIKEAILEVCNFVAGATDAVLRKWQEGVAMSACSAGCQGVAEGDLPNFRVEPGEPLVLGRVRATVAGFPSFEMLLMFPAAILGGDAQ